MPARLSVDRLPHARIIVPLVVFLYLAILRTRNITETFSMLGDQILYWRIALRPWRDLPLGGGPSSVGGTTLGPAFMWTMWVIRHVVGPWTQNLPHAGGIGLSLIQAAADVLLLSAVWKRFGSLALALAVTLAVATAPEEMSLSATIWNPPLALAFVKITIALVLLGDRRNRSVWWTAGATVTAVLAVQCHSSAVFFAVPVIASFTIRELMARRRDRALQCAFATAIVVLVLEAPYLADFALHGGQPRSPATVVGNVSYTFQNPGTLRPVAAFHAVAEACSAILLKPWSFAWFGTLLAACAVVTAYRTRDDVTLLCVTIVPLLAAVVAFSFWQLAFEHYWFLVLVPSATLTIGLALTAWRPAATLVAASLVFLIAAAQPSRFEYATRINHLPEYGALVRGSRDIRRRVAEVRGIETEFGVPPSTDRNFVYEVLGGRVTQRAPYSATIERTGHVRFTRVADGS
jgi:hypothetical protein